MTPTPDFQKVRKEYEDQGLDMEGLPDQPMDLFRSWYQNAVDNQPASWLEPNAISLATCGSDGVVSNRYVLMKGIVDSGIQFFTNYDSRKGTQIAQNPRAAAAFHWPFLGRQVRIEGAVEKTEVEVSRHYFHSRPRGSQVSAATSPQSQPVASRQVLADQAQEFAASLEGQEIPLPENWGGYLIKADLVEFWQGRPNRLHDRIVYQLDECSWQRQRFAP